LASCRPGFEAEASPGHWDGARYTDEAGHDNTVCAAYWDYPARFDAWFAQVTGRTGRGANARGVAPSRKSCVLT